MAGESLFTFTRAEASDGFSVVLIADREGRVRPASDVEQKLYDLLDKAYTRLMVSEGNARYIAANVALALQIAETVNVE